MNSPENKPMTIYISGPMTGHPDMNLDLFAKTEKQLVSLGYTVLNPHKIGETVNLRFFDRGMVPDYEDYLKEDIIQMLTHADAVLVLSGWRSSDGSKLEIANAVACGIRVVFDIKDLPAVAGTNNKENEK